MWAGVVLGLLLAAANAVAALVVLRLALRRSAPRSVHLVLGGMVVRLLLVGAATLVVLIFTQVHRIGFSAALLAGYLVFLGIEVAYLQRFGARPREAGAGPSNEVAQAGDGSAP